MENLRQSLSSIDVNNLLKIFDLQISLAVLIFFILFRGILSRILIKIYYIFTKNKNVPKESTMYKPLTVFFVFLGIFCAINILPVDKQILTYMNLIFRIIVFYCITRAICSLITEDSEIYKTLFKKSDNKAVDRFICKIIRAVIWFIFVIVVLKQKEMGFNFNSLGGLAAGLGIGSAALALAAQDIVKGLLSGLTILSDKPFVIGDWIQVGEYEGTVVDITFRSTRIKPVNNTVITIPNSSITSSYVINWNRLNTRRFETILNISLETPTEKIRKITKEIKLVLENNPDVVKGTVQVVLDGISACSSDIKIFLYVKEKEYLKYIKIKEDLLCSILFIVEKENIDLAYPTQTLYVKEKGETVE